MADVAAAAASTVVGTAGTVKTASADFLLKKSRRFVLWAMLGTLVVVMIAEIKKGETSRGTVFERSPRVFIGGAIVFFMLGMIVEVAPAFAKALAVLIFAGVLVTRGEEAFDAFGALSNARKRIKFQTGGPKRAAIQHGV